MKNHIGKVIELKRWLRYINSYWLKLLIPSIAVFFNPLQKRLADGYYQPTFSLLKATSNSVNLHTQYLYQVMCFKCHIIFVKNSWINPWIIIIIINIISNLECHVNIVGQLQDKNIVSNINYFGKDRSTKTYIC